MGGNLIGADARIWGLHLEGFWVTRIGELVEREPAYVRGVITGAWLDDKIEARDAKKARG